MKGPARFLPPPGYYRVRSPASLLRQRLGHVTDFIDVGPWPVFNLADASIVTGLVLLAWLFLRPGAQRRVTVGETGPNLASREVQQREESWCPICDGDMVWESVGWHCSTCGARERIEESYFVEENNWATAPDQAAGLPGVASTLATGGDGLRPLPGASAHAAGVVGVGKTQEPVVGEGSPKLEKLTHQVFGELIGQEDYDQ